MANDPYLSELKKQTRMMAQKEAYKMAAVGLIIGVAIGVYNGSGGLAAILGIALAVLMYGTTFRKYTKD